MVNNGTSDFFWDKSDDSVAKSVYFWQHSYNVIDNVFRLPLRQSIINNILDMSALRAFTSLQQRVIKHFYLRSQVFISEQKSINTLSIVCCISIQHSSSALSAKPERRPVDTGLFSSNTRAKRKLGLYL